MAKTDFLFSGTAFQSLEPEKAVAGGKLWTDGLLRPAGVAPRECGPDWERVGPGQPYLRDLEKEAGPLPKKRIRPAALPSGQFVVLREQKELRGFSTLQQALDAVQSGDVVEIRTDGPIPGGAVGVNQPYLDLTLTLRAAPGYLPVFAGDLSHWPRKGDFRLEGVFFDEGHFTGEFRNLTVRNCAFRAIHSDWTMGLKVDGAGNPARFINCIAVPGLGAGLGKGRTLIVDNCLCGIVDPESSSDDGPRDLTLTHSAVCANGLYGMCLLIQNADHKPRLEVARSLLACGQPLGLMNAPAEWKGAGNVYSVGGVYVYSLPFFSLDEWRGKYAGDVDSVDIGPSQLDPSFWRRLPESPGYRAAPDGTDMGADVSRVGVVTPAK